MRFLREVVYSGLGLAAGIALTVLVGFTCSRAGGAAPTALSFAFIASLVVAPAVGTGIGLAIARRTGRKPPP